jgi:Spherulation-specific family 4
MWLQRLLRKNVGRSSTKSRPARTSLRVDTLEDRTTPSTMNVLVPSYIYPKAGGAWDQMAADAKTVSITAILNPASGPGTVPNSDAQKGPFPGPDSNYQAAVSKLQLAGGQVIGYIHTSYDDGTISLATIKNEMLAYQNSYHVNGIFIDEMTSDAVPAHLAYYQQIYQMAHSLNANWIVVGNPGTPPVTAAYLTTPTADVLVDFENTSAKYASFMPQSWQASYPPTKFAQIIYGASSIATMQADVSLVAKANAGYIYVTDGSGGNPYSALPTYFNQFVTAVQTTPIVSTAPATHFTLTTSTATPTAGVSFTVTLKALDASGNTVAGYSGTVTLKTSDGQALIGSTGTVNVVGGSATFTVTLDRADSLSLQASTATLSGTAALRVNPAAAASFVISAPSSVVVGAAFTVTITAKDAYGNTATGYTGYVSLTSTDPKASSLGTYLLPSGTGVLTISGISLKTTGKQTLLLTSLYSTVPIKATDPLTVVL